MLKNTAISVASPRRKASDISFFMDECIVLSSGIFAWCWCKLAHVMGSSGAYSQVRALQVFAGVAI